MVLLCRSVDDPADIAGLTANTRRLLESSSSGAKPRSPLVLAAALYLCKGFLGLSDANRADYVSFDDHGDEATGNFGCRLLRCTHLIEGPG